VNSARQAALVVVVVAIVDGIEARAEPFGDAELPVWLGHELFIRERHIFDDDVSKGFISEIF
jgi:hypothetical protein